MIETRKKTRLQNRVFAKRERNLFVMADKNCLAGKTHQRSEIRSQAQFFFRKNLPAPILNRGCLTTKLRFEVPLFGKSKLTGLSNHTRLRTVT
jgi:hypothetical protein